MSTMQRAQKPKGRKRTPGARLLLDWRTSRSLTQMQVCEMLHMDGGRYSAYETGRLTPGLEIAAKIEVVTEGAVPVTVWVKDPATAKALAS